MFFKNEVILPPIKATRRKLIETARFDFIDGEMSYRSAYQEALDSEQEFQQTRLVLIELGDVELNQIQLFNDKRNIVNAVFEDAVRLAITEPALQLHRSVTFFGTPWANEAEGYGMGYTLLYSHNGKSRNIGVMFEKDRKKQRWAAFRGYQEEYGGY